MKKTISRLIIILACITIGIAMCGCSDTKSQNTYKCTISIDCKTILDNMEQLDEGVKDYIPDNGVILEKKEVEFSQGESVYDVLSRVVKDEKILMESSFVGTSAYVEGIDNIYEFSCGELSGWQYSVNGTYPGKSCSDYKLEAGDVIEWRYTCDLGEDLK